MSVRRLARIVERTVMSKAGQGCRSLRVWPMLPAGALLAAPGIALWSLLLIAHLAPSGSFSSLNAPLLAVVGLAILLSILSAVWLVHAAESGGKTQGQAGTARRLQILQNLCRGVAHDINGDLMAISGALEIIQRQGANERSIQQAAIGRTATKSIHQKLERLVGFAQDGVPRSRSVDLLPLCEGVRDFAASRFQAETRPITCNIPEGLWHVRADRDQLASALQDIVSYVARRGSDGASLSFAAVNLARAQAQAWTGATSPDCILIRLSSLETSLPQPGSPPQPERRPTGRANAALAAHTLAVAVAFTEENGAHLFVRSSAAGQAIVDLIVPRCPEP